MGSSPEYVYFIMNGIVMNQETQRYFESGQMINHDTIFQKQSCKNNLVAHTEVAVFKYEKETFLKICETFPDISEDIETFIAEKKEHIINDEFMDKNIKNDKVRKAIVDNYYELLDTDNQNQKYANKSLALKLHKDAKLFNQNRQPNVKFVSQSEKKKASKKSTSSRKRKEKKDDSEESDKSEGNPDIFDNESHDGEKSKKKQDVDTPGGEDQDREERVVTKVRDLLAVENHSSAMNIGKADLEKMFNM